MAQRVREVMTADPKTVDVGAPVVEAARMMADADVGAVVVVDAGQVAGIVTDRDVTVRAVAKGRATRRPPRSGRCAAPSWPPWPRRTRWTRRCG
jgi:CBS domain-containing protein